MEIKYIVISDTYLDEDNEEETRTGFGIAAVEAVEGVVLESYTDISSDMESVEELVELCNSLKLAQCHLCDVVDDFIGAT